MAHLKAFMLGIYEFRRSWTWATDDDALMESYDRGRDLAHRLTFRLLEER